MRKDNQKITYYQVQTKYKKQRKTTYGSSWFLHSDCLKFFFEDKVTNPNNRFSACGSCWQMTGVNGVMNKRAAINWFNKCKKWFKENPPEKDYMVELRLIKIIKTKKTEDVRT